MQNLRERWKNQGNIVLDWCYSPGSVIFSSFFFEYSTVPHTMYPVSSQSCQTALPCAVPAAAVSVLSARVAVTVPSVALLSDVLVPMRQGSQLDLISQIKPNQMAQPTGIV